MFGVDLHATSVPSIHPLSLRCVALSRLPSLFRAAAASLAVDLVKLGELESGSVSGRHYRDDDDEWRVRFPIHVKLSHRQ